MSTSISAGGQVPKDPSDEKVWAFSWDSHFASGVELASAGEFTVTAVRPRGESPVALEVSAAALMTGNRKVRFLITGGTPGTRYKVAHKVSTNEAPAQVRERSFFVQVSEL